MWTRTATDPWVRAGCAVAGERAGEWPDERLAAAADERGSGQLDVLFWQLAGGDPGPQRLGGQRAVALAIREPLGVDERIDRLSDQRPRQPGASERAGREGRQHGLEAIDVGRVVGHRRGRLPHRLHLAIADRAEQLDEQVLFGVEVAVQRPGRDTGALGDRGHRRGAVAALLDQLAGRAQEPLARG